MQNWFRLASVIVRIILKICSKNKVLLDTPRLRIQKDKWRFQ